MRAIALTHSVVHRPLLRTEIAGSIEMQTMHEALAREHMRRLEGEARRHRLVSESARGSRRRYVRTSERLGRQAHRRSMRSGSR